MIIQDIYLDRWDWCIRVYYYADARYERLIEEDLRDMDCVDAQEVLDSLFSKEFDTGLTYTNPVQGRSLIVINKTTSPEEFQSTFDHEKGHLTMHIAECLDINVRSEEYQYLAGEIGKQLFKEAKYFMCEHCRRRLLD